MKAVVRVLKIMQVVFLIVISLLLFSCTATRYQPAAGNISGGYSDIKVGPDLFRISFEGNAYISGEKAYKYTLYRAAEVTIENNCEWFEITEKIETARTDFAGCLGYVEKPRNAIVIRVIKGNPPVKAFLAKDIIKSLDKELQR